MAESVKQALLALADEHVERLIDKQLMEVAALRARASDLEDEALALQELHSRAKMVTGVDRG